MDKNKAWIEVHERIGRFIYARVNNHDIANDLKQTVFLKIAENLDKLKSEEKLVPWCYQIARNVITDHFRDLQKKREASEDLKTELKSMEFKEELLTKELSECLNPMVEQLEEPYKTAVKLSDFKGIPQKSLSQELNIPYSTLKTRVQRGRKQLKNLMEQCCNIDHDKYGQIINYEKRNNCCDC